MRSKWIKKITMSMKPMNKQIFKIIFIYNL